MSRVPGSGRIDFEDIASRLEKANYAPGRLPTPEVPGGMLLSGGLDRSLFDVDVKTVTTGYEEELDFLLRHNGHPGMKSPSMTEMMSRKEADRRRRTGHTSVVSQKSKGSLSLDGKVLGEDDAVGSGARMQMGITADQVKDGSQAVHFFATCDEDEEVKVMFLNRASPPKGPERLQFRPYDLEVVGREHIKPEHFTISAAGVVHIHPGQPSQFIPLADWWRRASMYNTLRMIPFFRNYLTAKVQE